jgi:hypothetical protein
MASANRFRRCRSSGLCASEMLGIRLGRRVVAFANIHGAAQPSNLLHPDIVCVLSKGTEVAQVRGEHGSARLRQGDDERIDRGASTRQLPQQRNSPCQRLGDLLYDVARLEKPVRESVAARMPLQTLDEHDGGNKGRPQILLAKRQDQRCRLLRPLGQTGDSTRIEDQHEGQPTWRVGRCASRRATAAARLR